MVLVDDHPIFRQGIKALLGRDRSIKVIGEAVDRDDAIAVMSKLQPDVALLDIRLKEGSGIDVTRAGKELFPNTKILVLTAYDDDRYVRSLARLGVNGYLLKTVSAPELRMAVHYVAEGGLVFPPAIADQVSALMENGTKAATPTRFNRDLTAREAEVLEHMGQGLRNREIAESMGVSIKTVETHIEQVLLKLGAKNRTQAVLIALKAGSVQKDESL